MADPTAGTYFAQYSRTKEERWPNFIDLIGKALFPIEPIIVVLKSFCFCTVTKF